MGIINLKRRRQSIAIHLSVNTLRIHKRHNRRLRKRRRTNSRQRHNPTLFDGQITSRSRQPHLPKKKTIANINRRLIRRKRSNVRRRILIKINKRNPILTRNGMRRRNGNANLRSITITVHIQLIYIAGYLLYRHKTTTRHNKIRRLYNNRITKTNAPTQPTMRRNIQRTGNTRVKPTKSRRAQKNIVRRNVNARRRG